MSEFTPPGGEPPRPDPTPDPWRGGHSPYPSPLARRTTSEELIRAERSRKMAGWALGLSFVWCLHPFTLLPSAGLAIAALARSGDGRNHGRRMAIGALVVDALWIALVVGLIVTGGLRGFLDDAERDEEGRVTEPTEISAVNLRAGDCVVDPALAGLAYEEQVEVDQIEVVPCRRPHDVEAYHDFELPDGDYPGEDEVFRLAENRCLPAARTFLGGFKGAARDLNISYYVPREVSWRLYDDRRVVCILGKAGEQTVGSLEGTGRLRPR